jgi:hypothetical protein
VFQDSDGKGFKNPRTREILNEKERERERKRDLAIFSKGDA